MEEAKKKSDFQTRSRRTGSPSLSLAAPSAPLQSLLHYQARPTIPSNLPAAEETETAEKEEDEMKRKKKKVMLEEIQAEPLLH